jgi:hypothetical protein
MAVLFVIMGTASKARGLILFLLNENSQESTHNKANPADAPKARAAD